MALKSADGRRTLHTQAGHPVCCEQALKSVGERNTHGGCWCGDLREATAHAKEVRASNTSGGGLVALLDIEGGDLAAGGSPPAGELLTGNIGSLRELAATTKSACFALLADLYLNINIVLYYTIIITGHTPSPRGYPHKNLEHQNARLA
jgi:hypothetical protein